MNLSGILNTIGIIFSFLGTIYFFFVSVIDKEWFKETLFNKIISSTFYTSVTAIFFLLVASIAFTLAYFVKNIEDKNTKEELLNDISIAFSQISDPPEKEQIREIIKSKGFNPDKFLELLSEGNKQNQGILFLYERKYPEAINSFKKSINEDEKNLAIKWLDLGNAYFLNEQFEEASNSYKYAIKYNSKLNPAWGNLGASLTRQKLYDEAIKSLEEAVKNNIINDHILMNWGVTLVEQEKYDKGIQKFIDALQINPESCKPYYNWGLALMKMKEFNEAIEKYQEAVKFCPNYASAWSNMGWCFDKLGNYESAVMSYKKSIKIQPDNASIWNNLGWLYFEYDQYEDAISCFKEAVEIDSSFEEAWYRWGSVLMKMNKNDEAIEKYEKAISINPDNEATWINLCQLLMAEDDYDRTDNAYQEAIKKFPESAILWLNWGTSFILRGEAENSLDKFSYASVYDKNFTPIWSNWSLALSSLGKYPEALEKIRVAVELNPGDAFLWSNYSEVLKDMGQLIEAQEMQLKANQIAQKQFAKEKRDRPYLTVEPIKFDDGNYMKFSSEDETCEISFKYQIKNSGTKTASKIMLPRYGELPEEMLKRGNKIGGVHPAPLISLAPYEKKEFVLKMVLTPNDVSPDEYLTCYRNGTCYQNFKFSVMYSNDSNREEIYRIKTSYTFYVNKVITDEYNHIRISDSQYIKYYIDFCRKIKTDNL